MISNKFLKESDGGNSACPLVRTLIKQRLAETEQQFKAMLALRKNMKSAIKQWETMEDKCPSSDMVCHLIDSFEQVQKS